MINWGLRCAQAQAREHDIRKMNIMERSAFWFRYERNTQFLRDRERQDTEGDYGGEVAKPEPEPKWTRGQWNKVQQVLSEVEHLRSQWYQHLKEDREYRAKKSKDNSAYKGIDIEA